MRHRFFGVPSLLLVIFGLALSPARALVAADPSAMVNDLVARGVATITDKTMTQPDRTAKFRELLEQGFDVPRIARFVMGRYWNGATDQERQTFTALFEDWIVRTYSARFAAYNGQTIQLMGTRPEGEVTTVVLSQFIDPNGAPPAKVEWHIRKEAEGSYKVVNISVEGVSMALTERDEIASVADRNGGTIAGVDEALQKQLASAAPAGQ